MWVTVIKCAWIWVLIVVCGGCASRPIEGSWSGAARHVRLVDSADKPYDVAVIDVDDGTAVHQNPWPGYPMIGNKFLVDEKLRALPAETVEAGDRIRVRGTLRLAFVVAPKGHEGKLGPDAEPYPPALPVIVVRSVKPER